jgi:hypothetical protein
VKIGLAKDSDAVQFYLSESNLSLECDITPVEVFKPYLEHCKAKR